MTGFQALELMLSENETIISVRLEERDIRIDLDDVLGGKVFTTPKADLELDGWELGYECTTCNGDGVTVVPCPRCAGRSLHSLLNNPCCDGWDERECNECERGTRWETDYRGGAH